MRSVEKAVSFIAAALMFGLMMLTVVDVIGRNILHHPLRGATELTEIVLVVLTFLLFPALALASKHIVADVADIFGSRMLDILQVVLTALLGAALFGLIAWRLWLLAGRATAYGDISPTFGFPVGPILYLIAILGGLCALAFLPPLFAFFRKTSTTEAHHSQQSIL